MFERTPGTVNTVLCAKHGKNEWKGHVVCSKCGAGYTTHDDKLPTHAPYRCGDCNARLVPPSEQLARSRRGDYSWRPLCAQCFEESAEGTNVSRHDRDSEACPGIECPFHGAQLRKLAKRAERAAKAAGKAPPASSSVVIPAGSLPGVLGEAVLHEQEPRS